MAEEVVGIIESGETGGSLKEGVTEADVQRIQENTRQMKKVAQQLQQDKKQNNQLAQFLTFLSEITNDKIIKGLYDTFFITVDPKTNIPYFRKSMNDVVVVGLFYPFFTEKSDEIGVSHYYENLNSAKNPTIEGYLTYLQDLSDHYHDNIPINQVSFIELLIEILKEFLPNSDNIDTSKNGNIEDTYKQIIYEKLYLGSEDNLQEASN